MRILTILMLVMVMSVSLGSDASAQMRISIVNKQKVMKESLAAQAANQQLDAKDKQFSSQFSAREKELKAQYETIVQQQATFSAEEKKQRSTEFRAKVAEAQKDYQTKRRSLEKAFQQANSDIHKNLVAIIKELVQERQLALVLPASQTMYYDPQMDISAEVVTRLNKRLPTLKLAF